MMEPKLNPKFENDAGAMMNLACAFAEKGKEVEARSYFDKAIQLAPEKGGHLLTYASYRLEKVIEKRKSGFKIIAADVEELNEIDELLNRAIKIFEEVGENKVPLVSCWVNKSSINAILDNHAEALEDTKKALAIKPDSALAHANKGRIHRMLKQCQEAKDEFETALKCGGDKDELMPMLIESLQATVKRDSQAPLNELKKYYSEEEMSGGNVTAVYLVVEIYANQNKHDEAESILKKAYEIHGRKPQLLLAEATLRKVQKNYEAFENLSVEIANASGTLESTIAVLERGSHYKKQGKYDEARKIFEKYVSEGFYDDVMRDYLVCLYKGRENRSENIKKCLEMCREFERGNKGKPFVLDMQLAINQELDNLDECDRLYKVLVDENSDDYSRKLDYAAFLISRRGEYVKEGCRLLEQVEDQDLTGEDLCKIAKMMLWLERPDDAIRYVYRAYEARPNDLQTQLLYVNIFLGRGDRKTPMLDSEHVAADFYVKYQQDGREMNMLITDNQDASLARNEIFTGSGLGKQLMGKKVGDEFETSVGDKFKIMEVKSKYVRIFQELMESINLNFPDDKTIQKMKYDPEKIKASVKAVSERHNQIVEYYQSKRITIGLLANLLKRDMFEVWGGIVADKNIPLYFATGSFEEQQSEQALAGQSKRVVIDFVAIRTLMQLKLLPVIAKYFDEVLVVKASLDEFDQKIMDLKSRTVNGFSTLVYRNGQYFYDDISPEKVKEHIQNLEEDREQLSKCFNIASMKSVPTKKTERDNDIFGEAYINAIQVCQENKIPLYCDDLLFRQLVAKEYGIKGFSTQNLLVACLSKKLISESQYFDCVYQLASMGYYYVSISGKMLYHIAEKHSFLPEKIAELEPFLKILGSPETTVGSLVNVLSEFIKELYLETLPENIKSTYLDLSLELIISKGDGLENIKLFVKSLQSKLGMASGVILPRIQRNVKSWIRANYSAGGRILRL